MVEESISLWVNEKRYERLNKVGLTNPARDVLAGMKILQLRCTEKQKDSF